MEHMVCSTVIVLSRMHKSINLSSGWSFDLLEVRFAFFVFK